LKTKGVVSSEKALKSWKLALENLVNCDQVLDFLTDNACGLPVLLLNLVGVFHKKLTG
jgi:hypothetical protein